jgi:hypothetical protein
MVYFLKINFNFFLINFLEQIIYGDGDWGLGIGDWGLGPIPNPQSPIPNPQSPNKLFVQNLIKKKIKINF